MNVKQAVAVLNVLMLAFFAPGGAGLWPAVAMAQGDEPPPAALSPQQLDDLVAPIALYPDPLLAQVLPAATFPTDVVQAARWAEQHKNLKGQQLTDAVVQANLPYDASVISLLQFPSVLQKMNQDLNWTTSLGNAVLTQRGDLMDAIQRMRRKAEQAGNLKTSEQIQVKSSPQVIEIQPANPQVIYVPTYNPQVVYAPPPPPPPPGPSTGAVIATGLISFGLGVAVGAAASNNSCCWYGGSMGWSSHTVVVANNSFNRTWATRTTVVTPAPYYRGGAYRSGTVNNVNVNNINVNNANINNRNVNNTNVNNRNVNNNNVNNANVNNRSANNENRNNRNLNSANANTASAGERRANSGDRAAERGYSQPQSSGRASAFSGAENGRSERQASERGRTARRGR